MGLCPASERIMLVRRGNKMVSVVGTQGALVRPAYEALMAETPVTPLRSIYFERFDTRLRVWLEDKSFGAMYRNDLEGALKVVKMYDHIFRIVVREFRGEELVREYLVKSETAAAAAHQLPRDITYARKARKTKGGKKTRAY